MKYDWLALAKRLQSIAQAGLTYSENIYDLERYEELQNISTGLVSHFAETPQEVVKELFANEKGYLTPKTDVRGVVFREGKILLVRERVDGCWSLPGGWADVGFTPAEVAVKEVGEEAGLEVEAVRLLAVLDRNKHTSVPSPYHIYKLFFLCRAVSGGEPHIGMETTDVGFFGRDELPELSLGRNTAAQIKLMFDFLDNPAKEVVFD